MRIGLLVDATCDLPPAWLAEHGVHVLPIPITLDGRELADNRDPALAREFLDHPPGRKLRFVHSGAYSTEAIEALFLKQLVTRYDCVFVLTASATRSATHKAISAASYQVLGKYRDARRAAGRDGQFLIRVVDTRSLFAGSAVLVTEAARLIEAGEGATAVRDHLEHLANHVNVLAVPRDLYAMHVRAHRKGERTVGTAQYLLGNLLNIRPLLHGWRGETRVVAKRRGFETAARLMFEQVAERVRLGLMVPQVCLSYGGSMDELHALPGHAQLAQVCEQHRVRLLESPMSLVGLVNVGAGTVNAGFVCAPWEPAG